MSLVAYGGTLALVSAAPGPIVAVVLARTLAGQPMGALAFAAGVTLGNILALSLALGGLALWIIGYPDMLTLLRVLGAAYLIWLGIDLWRSTTTLDMAAPRAAGGRLGLSLGAGLLASLASPYYFLFYLSLLPAVLGPDGAATHGHSALLLVTGLSVALVFGLYIVAAAHLCRYLQRPGRQKRVNGSLALCLVGAGLWYGLA
jgi:threonine/homoserine/homoserine lactone efflux protein